MSELLPLVFPQEQWRMKGHQHWHVSAKGLPTPLSSSWKGTAPTPGRPLRSPLRTSTGAGKERAKSFLALYPPPPPPMVSFKWWQPSESPSKRELLLETWHHRHVTSRDSPTVQVCEMRSQMSYSCVDSFLPLEAHRVQLSLVKVFTLPVFW